MKTDIFDFELPERAIALVPVEPRDSARMLVVDPGRVPPLADAHVSDLVSWLRPGDALVFNDTRVIPAALEGRRDRAGVSANVSFNLLRRVDASHWRALARPQKRLAVADTVHFGDLRATVTAKLEAGEVELEFKVAGEALDRAIEAVGAMPLPPYIALKRKPDARDRERYQTVYAAKDGAVAAPTAGLHFTPELLSRLRDLGISQHFVTLHVGAGTFLPVKVEDTRDHKMHSEWGEVAPSTVGALRAVKARGGRIIAVGTTSLRLLETAAQSGVLEPFCGDTAIFISPGYTFKAVDALLTNFHLPRSTLFMLVSAFSGRDTMKAAYAHAISAGYRFYSYGDASLLFPARTAPADLRETS